MSRGRAQRLFVLNDSRLAAYLAAAGEAERSRELERVLEQHVRPSARQAVQAYRHGDFPVGAYDEDDLVSEVVLRMIRKLRAAVVLEEESIQDVEAYVVTLTRNALRDLMRHRSPHRTRLRSRLRYLLSHHRRLALWNYEGTVVGGLAARRGEAPGELDAAATERLLGKLPAAERLASEALLRLFIGAGFSLRFAVIATIFSRLWGISDAPAELAENVAAQPARPEGRLEWRQYLDLLWTEVAALPPQQRAALLLNLRAPGSENATVLFIAAGIASVDDIAAAVAMTPQELARVWDELPLDDLTIASLLRLTRQQVINLRKSARERLARRMSPHTRPSE